jgi:hypothetical protein
MTTYIYRWFEGESGPFEVRGNLASIEKMALRLELPIRPFRAELLHEDGTPANSWSTQP